MTRLNCCRVHDRRRRRLLEPSDPPLLLLLLLLLRNQKWIAARTDLEYRPAKPVWLARLMLRRHEGVYARFDDTATR